MNIIDMLNNINENVSFINIIIFLISGLIDGINPCVLSMLIFFIMTLIRLNHKTTNILVFGFLFALGTFIAYSLAGYGIINILFKINFIKNLPKYIYPLIVVFAFVMAFLNFKDAVYAKKLDIKNIKLQLPKKNKKFIHHLMNKMTSNTFKYISSFVLGFLVTLSELLCTGQIYMTTIITLYQFGELLRNFYLLIFNIGFITPILIITLIFYKTKEIISVSDTFLNKLWIIKIITGILMLVFGVYGSIYYLKYI